MTQTVFSYQNVHTDELEKHGNLLTFLFLSRFLAPLSLRKLNSMSQPDASAGRFAGKTKEAEDPNEKALRIKVSALRRTIKDLLYAKREVERETARLEQVRSTDPDRVSQQEKVIDEARMMVPHSENRIMSSVNDLLDFIEKEGHSIANEELIEQAHAAISDGKSALC